MVAVTEHTCIFIPGQAIAWGPEPTPFMTTLALARRCGWGNEVHYRLHAWALDADIICGRIDDEPPPWDNLMALTPTQPAPGSHPPRILPRAPSTHHPLPRHPQLAPHRPPQPTHLRPSRRDHRRRLGHPHRHLDPHPQDSHPHRSRPHRSHLMAHPGRPPGRPHQDHHPHPRPTHTDQPRAHPRRGPAPSSRRPEPHPPLDNPAHLKQEPGHPNLLTPECGCHCDPYDARRRRCAAPGIDDCFWGANEQGNGQGPLWWVNRCSEACITHPMVVHHFTPDSKRVYHRVVTRGREVPTSPRRKH